MSSWYAGVVVPMPTYESRLLMDNATFKELLAEAPGVMLLVDNMLNWPPLLFIRKLPFYEELTQSMLLVKYKSNDCEMLSWSQLSCWNTGCTTSLDTYATIWGPCLSDGGPMIVNLWLTCSSVPNPMNVLLFTENAIARELLADVPGCTLLAASIVKWPHCLDITKFPLLEELIQSLLVW